MSLARGCTTTKFSKKVSLSFISAFSHYVKHFLHY